MSFYVYINHKHKELNVFFYSFYTFHCPSPHHKRKASTTST